MHIDLTNGQTSVDTNHLARFLKFTVIAAYYRSTFDRGYIIEGKMNPHVINKVAVLTYNLLTTQVGKILANVSCLGQQPFAR